MVGSGTTHMPQLKLDHTLTPHRDGIAAAFAAEIEYQWIWSCYYLLWFNRNTPLLIARIGLKAGGCWESSCPIWCVWGWCLSSHPGTSCAGEGWATAPHLPPCKPDPLPGPLGQQGLSVAVAGLLFAQMYAHAQECFFRTFWPISN